MHLGVYIHIPFCASKCPYCDFNSYATSDPEGSELVRRYLSALKVEISSAARLPEVDGRKVASIFFGGGTPSLLKAEDLNQLLTTCREVFSLSDDVEVTLEANPGTVSYEKLLALRQGGFNRISFGAQSFQPHVLQRLGRIHSAEETVNSFLAARRAGFDNINLDFIFAVPGQSFDDWQRDLRQAASMEPDHISVYSLTIEPGTAFGELNRKGRFRPVDEATDAAMFGSALGYLTEAGYQHYEISNFARPGLQCAHNLIYWNNEEWLGLGAGAHQHLNRVRRWNVRSPAKYADLIESLGDATEDSERPGVGTQMGETMMMGLRLTRGISFASFRDRFGLHLSEAFSKQIDKLLRMELIQIDQDRLSLTRKGILFANLAFVEFV